MTDDRPFISLDEARKRQQRTGRSKKAPPPRDHDPRPVIQIRIGDLAGMVDEVEAAIIKADLGIYQRSNVLVSTGITPVITADRREIGSQQIIAVGDHALLEAAMRSARFEKFDARSNCMVPANCSMVIIRALEQRAGRYRFPLLAGIVNAPTLRADGSLLEAPGYDETTGLLFDPAGSVFPPIPARPSKAQAEVALNVLLNLIDTFPFVGEADRSVALSAILTACVRRSLRTAPLHGFSAPVAGSGKSKLVDIANAIATGREAGVVAMGANPEELEKRLVSLLLGGAAIAIDNVETQLSSDFLCQVLTQATVRPRILGRSETPELPTNTLVTATGNNLILAGDMTRRGLLSRLDPQVERPELRTFDFEPVALVKADRGRYVVAVLTVLRAYHVAGKPAQASALGSFEEWSRLVRDALMWLGQADPVETMEQARTVDPKLERLRSVMVQWRAVIGSDQVTASDAAHRASEKQPTSTWDPGSKPGFLNPEFREAMLAVAGASGFIDTGKLGTWLGRNKSRVVDGSWFECDTQRKGVTTWRMISPVEPGRPTRQVLGSAWESGGLGL